MTCSDIKIKSNLKELGANIYTPANELKGAILMASATGIKRKFYHSFAEFLSSQGFGVLTFDFEGIGDSLNGEIKNCKASIISWGQEDLNIAFKELQIKFPNTNYHLIGHSAGGQLIGLIEEHHKLSSVFNFACSSGYLKNMPFPFNLKAQFFMNMFIPLSNLFSGYTKSDLVGMGEPLPKLVSENWRDWCNAGGYIGSVLNTEVKNHFYDKIKCPSMWAFTTDDHIANEKNVDDMISIFDQLPTKKLQLIPKNEGCTEIGHMKFFSKKNKHLWNHALNWLDKNN